MKFEDVKILFFRISLDDHSLLISFLVSDWLYMDFVRLTLYKFCPIDFIWHFDWFHTNFNSQMEYCNSDVKSHAFKNHIHKHYSVTIHWIFKVCEELSEWLLKVTRIPNVSSSAKLIVWLNLLKVTLQYIRISRKLLVLFSF